MELMEEKYLHVASVEGREGYRLTEVGWIPEDWEVKAIKKFSTVVRGGSPRPAGDPKYFNGDFIPWLTVAALTNIPTSQLHVFETFSFLTEEGSKLSRILEPETLIIANSGATLGIAKILNVKCCANDGIAALLDVNKGIDPQYVANYINTITKRLREVVATGNGQPNLNTELIGNILVPFPPTEFEQSAIATSLSDADELIRGLEKLIAKKRSIKQGAMQELLTGRRRLPGFKDKWQLKTFEDIADKQVKWSITGGPFGSNLKATDYTDSGIRIIQLQNIGDGTFHDEYAIFTSLEKAEELISCNIYSGDIILSKMGDPVARACFVPGDGERFLMASDGIRLVVDEKEYNKRFVHDYINSIYFRKNAFEVSSGSTRLRIGLPELKKLPIVKPSLKEQTAIAKILSDMDAEIAALEAKLEKYKKIKQGMMQNLLTGRIRLV